MFECLISFWYFGKFIWKFALYVWSWDFSIIDFNFKRPESVLRDYKIWFIPNKTRFSVVWLLDLGNCAVVDQYDGGEGGTRAPPSETITAFYYRLPTSLYLRDNHGDDYKN